MRNNSKAAAKRTQIVRSEPEFVKIGTKEVTSKKGITTTVGIYRRNQNSNPIKAILHPTIPPGGGVDAWNCFAKRKKRNHA